ncbi:unnamed protein product [Cylindrotheca closterium]|uniref:Uncharacterized protein n=1 Tax=Cylindrotheca closterium TaxID=2856 RepID=A0AAD2G231_9STRA|nr:unnamed protein product [Cylindrotheca closterium]
MPTTPPLEIVRSISQDTESFVTQSSVISQEELETTQESSEQEDLVASKYRKMLQMGIPLLAIEFGMAINGVNPDIMTSILKEEDTPVSDPPWFRPNSERLIPEEEHDQEYEERR